MRTIALLGLFLLVLSVGAQGPMLTRWGKRLDRANPHPEYPRPQMVRPNWVNLNGEWSVAVIQRGGAGSAADGTKILVPFPIESQLSGVGRRVAPTDTTVYTRQFDAPKGERVLLHFGASDWHTIVHVNGTLVGEHKGGYDPFTFDITASLKPTGKQHLRVEVKDPTDAGTQPRGKQVAKPGGIWYTPTSGIWQTVWLEAVPNHSIDGLDISASNDGSLRVAIKTRTAPGSPKAKSFFYVAIGDGKRNIKGSAVAGGTAVLKIAKPRLWSPESPTLYPLTVSWMGDSVTSYFAFREVSLKPDATGQPRICLNGKQIFLIGPLDQGFWPDGLYTAPSDEALKYDLEVTKRLGFNFIRKHVKVEPDRWYSWCDKMGILVFQDMPSGDKYIGGDDPDITRTPESAEIYERELKANIESRRNHPCIIGWVPYNEGWGQWDTGRIVSLIKSIDPTRLVDSASGWTDRGVGDLYDVHVYPGPGAPSRDAKRALFLGEFGGLGLPVEGHTWQKEGWGYQSFKTADQLTDRFVEIFTDLRQLIDKPGLSGGVYTQTTDCETELNGLMTYDRAIIKMDEKRVRAAVDALFKPAPIVETVVPTAELKLAEWRYLTTSVMPNGKWVERQLDDSGWSKGMGGFGTPETPNAIIGTRWDTKDIFLRRRFTLPRDFKAGELWLRMSYDDDVEVYIDDHKVFEAPGWTSNYRNVPLKGAFAKGEHLLAIHCHQNQGGQYIDAGLVSVKER